MKGERTERETLQIHNERKTDPSKKATFDEARKGNKKARRVKKATKTERHPLQTEREKKDYERDLILAAN